MARVGRQFSCLVFVVVAITLVLITVLIRVFFG